MKKIEFGFSNDFDPKGSFEGIGIKPGVLLTDADYYGSMEFDGNYYIVAKVVEDEFNNYPQLLGKYIVRQALCDLFADGSSILMLNQEETPITRKFEERLNSPEFMGDISNIRDIINILYGVHMSSRAFLLCELGEKILSTSIRPDAFERKNNAINSCHDSISEMQQELANRYTR